MTKLKPLFTFLLILAVLVLAYFASLYLADKAKEKELNKAGIKNSQTEKGAYTNNEFGFSLQMPEEWTDYKVDQTEGDLMFSLPTTAGFIDPVTNKTQKYAGLFNIIAIPLNEAKAQDKKCATPDPDRYWGECVGVINNLGENNFYRFAWGSSGFDYPPDFTSEKIARAEEVTKNIKIFDIKEMTPMRTLSRINAGFSLQYPTGMFKANYGAEITLPFTGYKFNTFSDTEFSHTINTQYCALSGTCTPTTTDMTFGIMTLKEFNLADLKKSDIGQNLITQDYGGNKALVLSQGAEGEGMEYYFFENPNGGLLMVYYKYINENVVTSYKKTKDFIPYSKQTQIMNGILESIKFTN